MKIDVLQRKEETVQGCLLQDGFSQTLKAERNGWKPEGPAERNIILLGSHQFPA